VALPDEKVCFVERIMRAADATASQFIRRIHNGILSSATFLMNEVSRQTG
jgi:hypothetical protein